MEDIDAVIEAAKHFKYEKVEPETRYRFNRISKLPESKANLQRAIKDRIRELYASYISLASFLSDEDVNLLLDPQQNKKRARKIIRRMVWEMDKFEREIRAFNPFELPTDGA